MGKNQVRFRLALDFYFLLFIFSAIFSLLILAVKLDKFPISFLADEAAPVVKAEYLLKHGFRDEIGQLFPVVMDRFGKMYNLGLIVYFNIPGYLLVGKNITGVRLTSVLMSFLGLVVLSVILKKHFNLNNYWLIPLYLVNSSIFFLSARTGFEVSTAASLYICSLYFYLEYRLNNKKTLPLTVIFLFITFYTYTGQIMIVGLTLIVFFLADLKYHLRHLRQLLISISLAILLLIPYLTFYFKHKEAITNLVYAYDIYPVLDYPLSEKISVFSKNFLKAFDYRFLFYYHESYFSRNSLWGYGMFPYWSLPAVFLGLIISVLRIKEFPYRFSLLLFFITPISCILMKEGPTQGRIMPIFIPFAMFFAFSLNLIEKYLLKIGWLKLVFSLGLVLFLSLSAFRMLTDAVKNGPLWYRDYGLYGMQWGAEQLFTDARKLRSKYKNIVISTAFANAVNLFFDFFLSSEEKKHIKLIGVDNYYDEVSDFSNTLVIVDDVENLNLMSKKNLYKKLISVGILKAPDGQPLFFKFELGK